MSDYLDSNGVDNLVMLAISAAFLLIFWILESAWRNDRRWLLPIFVFPPIILAFVYVYWEETRAKCFFVALYVLIITLLGSATGFNFTYRVWLIFEHLAFWPYYLYNYLRTLV